MAAPTLADLALTHLNLDVVDLDASELFYRDVFALPVTRNGASLAVRTPNFLLVLSEGKPRVEGSFHFGFRVDSTLDVDAWFAHFRGRDVIISEAPVERGAVYVGRVTDPDGYTIEISCDR